MSHHSLDLADEEVTAYGREAWAEYDLVVWAATPLLIYLGDAVTGTSSPVHREVLFGDPKSRLPLYRKIRHQCDRAAATGWRKKPKPDGGRTFA